MDERREKAIRAVTNELSSWQATEVTRWMREATVPSWNDLNRKLEREQVSKRVRAQILRQLVILSRNGEIESGWATEIVQPSRFTTWGKAVVSENRYFKAGRALAILGVLLIGLLVVFAIIYQPPPIPSVVNMFRRSVPPVPAPAPITVTDIKDLEEHERTIASKNQVIAAKDSEIAAKNELIASLRLQLEKQSASQPVATLGGSVTPSTTSKELEEVVNKQGETIGKLEDTITKQAGRIASLEQKLIATTTDRRITKPDIIGNRPVVCTVLPDYFTKERLDSAKIPYQNHR
jgi:hypothetical protein